MFCKKSYKIKQQKQTKVFCDFEKLELVCSWSHLELRCWNCNVILSGFIDFYQLGLNLAFVVYLLVSQLGTKLITV